MLEGEPGDGVVEPVGGGDHQEVDPVRAPGLGGDQCAIVPIEALAREAQRRAGLERIAEIGGEASGREAGQTVHGDRLPVNAPDEGARPPADHSVAQRSSRRLPALALDGPLPLPTAEKALLCPLGARVVRPGPVARLAPGGGCAGVY